MDNENNDFNFQKALQAIQNGQPLLGKEGILNPLIKQPSEVVLEREISSHLAQELSVQRRNGKSKKTIKFLRQIAQRKFRTVHATRSERDIFSSK